MANVVPFFVKRSTTTAVPANLYFGEMGYSTNGDVIFIGMANGVPLAVAGARNPGVLTANQAIVVNSTSYIDKIKVASLGLNNDASVNVSVINATSNSTTLGAASNTELATTFAIKNYVSLAIAAGGSIPGSITSNSTNLTIQANSTVSVTLVANTLTLTTPLAGTSGGTGLNTYTNNDILVANSTNGFNKLALGTAGKLLQSNGTALIYGDLDGGTF